VEMLTEQLNNERHELKEVRGALSEVQQDRLRAQQQLTQAQAELEALQAQLAVQQPMLDTQSDCNNQQIPAPVMPSVPLPSVAALNGSLAAAQASVEEVIALRQALQDSEAERQQLALQVHELQRIVGQHSMDMEMLSSRADRLDKDEGALNEQVGWLYVRNDEQAR
jgi:small-conductance mechanosensitive channel